MASGYYVLNSKWQYQNMETGHLLYLGTKDRKIFAVRYIYARIQYEVLL